MKSEHQQIYNNNPLQSFGHLIITDYKLQIQAISESALSFSPLPPNELLGSSLEIFLLSLLGKKYKKLNKKLFSIISKRIPNQFFSTKINHQLYYFKLHAFKGHVYIEWEDQQRKHLPLSRMNELGFLFDDTFISNWNHLCKALLSLLKFERVFTLQIYETGQSCVIAEHRNGNEITLKGKEFDRSFLPSALTTYYNSLSYRYVPSLNDSKQQLYTIDPDITLLCSQLMPMPQLHERYLKSIGVKSALFFPLYLQGEFWGLVIAQHPQERKVDLHQRKLCTFIVQSAMSKFENKFKQGLIEQSEQLQESENTLKQALAHNKTLNCAMVQHMELLQAMAQADGFAIYDQGDVYFSGLTPNIDLFNELIQYLQENCTKTIFKDYNFRLQHGMHLSQPLPFAGLLYYTLGKEKNYYLVWFRKEKISSIVQFEEYEIEGKSQIKTWEQSIYDSALPWDENDLKFINLLQQIIQESIVSKATEKQTLTDELKILNNELEMFTFSLSHDLKNPLSILKMGLQFLRTAGHNLSNEKKEEWLKNLSGSVSNIEDIIDNIVNLNRSKSSTLAKDPIPMAYTIQKICKESVMIYNAPHCKIKLGQLLPVWGEKSALFQVFLNIINNAIKYSRERKQPILTIDSEMDDLQVCYLINDNGIGIPSEYLPTIFDIFVRASNANTVEGTGVGLSLVKRIMERMGGSIEIDSVEAEGTTIRLYFPIVSPFPITMMPTPSLTNFS